MKYLIKIEDTHLVEGETESSELMIVGTASFYGDDYKIRYKETDEQFKNSFVILSVENGCKVTMQRSGEFTTVMVMEKHKRHSCVYSTPVGSFIMGIYTSEVKSDMTADGGTLTFRYTLDVNNNLISENILKVTLNRKD